MTQPLVEHPLELAGFDTRALELEGEGPPLLLLHGFADSADTWRWALDRLARENRRALALDQPGFGTCAPLREDEPILDQLGAFSRAALEYLAPDGGAVVCGNSLGGCVALRLSEDPELGLAGVVPIAPAGLDMARWVGLIERELGLRIVLSAPVPTSPCGRWSPRSQRLASATPSGWTLGVQHLRRPPRLTRDRLARARPPAAGCCRN